jgi:beta-D-xylosidase 4
MNLVEANTAVNSACYAENVCATNFPSPAGLAASFNASLWRTKGAVISDEMRALSNSNWVRFSPGSGAFIGLTGFGPNINLARDPRWGRNSEVPSEDPFLAGSYATEYVRGMQEGADSRYLKMIAGLKHYTAYSVENDRASFIPNITDFDLWDSFLPHYKMGFSTTGGNAAAVMTSYSGVNGVPACDNDFITNKVLRGAWGRSDVIVGTDCGAISDSIYYQHYATDAADAASKAMNGGTDLDLGDDFFAPVAQGGNGGLTRALQEGLIDMSKVDASLERVLTARFKVGLFDPLEDQQYVNIPISVVNSTEHQDVVFDAALQSFVLLKNDGNVLPFKAGLRLAVLGPHVATQRDLFESYMGDQVCYGGGYDCVPTIGDVFADKNGRDNTVVVRGVDMTSTTKDTTDYQAALDAASGADQVVLAMGIGNSVEYETHDRDTLNLPGLQEQFVLDVLALKKPTVLVLINGGIVSIEKIEPVASAILEAWYPAQRGAVALFSALFGESNRFGKMPVTLYESTFINEQEMHNFDMTTPPGRTYRYYTNRVTFPFGYGLSYTTFAYKCNVVTPTAVVSGSFIEATCTISNTGERDGDEVVQVYHAVSNRLRATLSHPAPLQRGNLIGFQRVSLSAGSQKDISFSIPMEQLAITTNNGDRILYAGMHELTFTNGVAGESTHTIVVQATTVFPTGI